MERLDHFAELRLAETGEGGVAELDEPVGLVAEGAGRGRTTKGISRELAAGVQRTALTGEFPERP